MTTETIVGTYINAPWTIIVRDGSEVQEILVLKTLEFLMEKNINWDYDYFLGGNRTAGCGRVFTVKTNERGNYLVKNRNLIGVKQENAELINQKFEKIIAMLKDKFPIKAPLHDKDRNNGKNEKKSKKRNLKIKNYKE
ncbi:MAG: hypothetical protein ACTSRG_18440 [Candidatus Helarchaeota archaeon]